MVARLTRIIPLLLLLAFVAGVVYVVAAWRYSPARAKEILIKAFTVLNRILRLGKLVCAVGEQRRCAGFNAFVHGYGVGGAGGHADMPRSVPEAQPLVSDEADESEAFAPLALGKKVIMKAPDFGRLLLWCGRALGKRFSKERESVFQRACR